MLREGSAIRGSGTPVVVAGYMAEVESPERLGFPPSAGTAVHCQGEGGEPLSGDGCSPEAIRCPVVWLAEASTPPSPAVSPTQASATIPVMGADRAMLAVCLFNKYDRHLSINR